MLTHDVPLRKFLPILERAEPLIKDHTAVKCFKECKRKYFYRMVCGRAPKKSALEGVFAWGISLHKFAELYSVDFDMKEATAKSYPLFKKPLPDSKWKHLTTERWTETVDLLAKFLDQEKKDGYRKTISVEAPLNIELPDGSIIGGRTDAIVKFGGQTWIRDYKTTSKRIDYFLAGLDPNDQVTRYVYMVSKLMGWDSKVQSSSTKANGVEFFVINNEPDLVKEKKHPKIVLKSITRSHDQLASFERQQIFYHKLMDMCRENDEWPMEESNCGWGEEIDGIPQYGCDYIQVCRSPTEESMAHILRSNFLYQPWDHQKVEQEVG